MEDIMKQLFLALSLFFSSTVCAGDIENTHLKYLILNLNQLGCQQNLSQIKTVITENATKTFSFSGKKPDYLNRIFQNTNINSGYNENNTYMPIQVIIEDGKIKSATAYLACKSQDWSNEMVDFRKLEESVAPRLSLLAHHEFQPQRNYYKYSTYGLLTAFVGYHLYKWVKTGPTFGLFR